MKKISLPAIIFQTYILKSQSSTMIQWLISSLIFIAFSYVVTGADKTSNNGLEGFRFIERRLFSQSL